MVVLVEPLSNGKSMKAEFKILGGMEGKSFSVVYCDGSKWIEESVSLENGYDEKTMSSTMGTFLLVVK